MDRIITGAVRFSDFSLYRLQDMFSGNFDWWSSPGPNCHPTLSRAREDAAVVLELALRSVTEEGEGG